MALIPWRNKGTAQASGESPGGGALSRSSMERLRRDLDRVFDGFFRGDRGDARDWKGWGEIDRLLSPVAGWGPAVDLCESEDNITVKAELPGLAPEGIQLQVSGGLLTISGEKKDEYEDPRSGYQRIERRFGAFSRSIQLPSEVEAEKAEAQFHNGVLTVVLPKSAESTARKITIKPG